MTHPKNNILGRLGEVVDIGDEAINIIPGGGFGAGQTESLHHDARHCHDLRTGNTVPDGKWGTLAQSLLLEQMVGHLWRANLGHFSRVPKV
jgi:hypothetical protein